MTRSYALFTIALSLILLATSNVVESKTLSFPFEKRHISPTTSSVAPLRRRATSRVGLVTGRGPGTDRLYLITVTIGSNKQSIGLQFDTGSSDLWVPWNGLPQCLQKNMCIQGSFDPTKSTSYKDFAPGFFSESYFDGTSVTGDYFTDSLTVGQVSLPSYVMGLATNGSGVFSTDFYGIMGVGFATQSTIANSGQPYPNLINTLKSSGIIGSSTFSLWLDDLDAGKGTVLFGGYDSAKFEGEMEFFPMILNSPVQRYKISWNNIQIQDSNGEIHYNKTNLANTAVLDSGTSLTELPSNIAADIASFFDVTNDSTWGYIVPCSMADNADLDFAVEFGFGGSQGPTIYVPLRELVVPFAPGVVGPLLSGKTSCQWGIKGGAGEFATLGDTFLRSAYVLYDLDNTRIGLANALFDVTDSNIVSL